MFYKVLLYIKNKWHDLLLKHRETILNTVKDYYENDKERLRVQARDKYRNLSEEDKNKKKRIWKKQIS